MLYDTKCWAIKRYHAQKISVAEMRMLCWMCSNTRKDKVRNEDIRTKIDVTSIEEKMREIAYDNLLMCDVDLQMRQSDESSVSKLRQVKRA